MILHVKKKKKRSINVVALASCRTYSAISNKDGKVATFASASYQTTLQYILSPPPDFATWRSSKSAQPTCTYGLHYFDGFHYSSDEDEKTVTVSTPEYSGAADDNSKNSSASTSRRPESSTSSDEDLLLRSGAPVRWNYSGAPGISSSYCGYSHRERWLVGIQENLKTITSIGSAGSMGVGSLESTLEIKKI
jgi:hypothetical protein